MNKEFLHMQKLAGLITESELKQKLNENESEVGDLMDLDIINNYSNQEKLVDYLGQYVTRPDIYKTNPEYWENMLFNTYDEWMDSYGSDEEIESDQEEWDNIHNEMQDNYEYNYFVRNFAVGDDEDSRHEDDINQDIKYFINKYNIPNHVAMIMKKLVDEYLANALGL